MTEETAPELSPEQAAQESNEKLIASQISKGELRNSWSPHRGIR